MALLLSGRDGVAGRLRPLVEPLFGGELPIRIRAWDGSEIGPPDGPAAVLAHPRALRRLLWQPGELGLAQAYVTGDLEVDGDLLDGLSRIWSAARERDLHLGRLQDYRAVDDGPFDAVASIEMGEHVGRDGYPTYAGQLHRLVREEGRVLVQQMSRGDRFPGGGPFIESFVAPDMHMRPVGETVALLERAGLEVRDVQAMREHYVRTVGAWLETFEDNIDAVVDLVGREAARVWRLYLVGGLLSFRDGRMGVDQILAVRPRADGTSGFPAVRSDGVG